MPQPPGLKIALKRGAQIVDREPAVAAIERVERASEQRPAPQHPGHRQRADDGDDTVDGQ